MSELPELEAPAKVCRLVEKDGRWLVEELLPAPGGPYVHVGSGATYALHQTHHVSSREEAHQLADRLARETSTRT